MNSAKSPAAFIWWCSINSDKLDVSSGGWLVVFAALLFEKLVQHLWYSTLCLDLSVPSTSSIHSVMHRIWSLFLSLRSSRSIGSFLIQFCFSCCCSSFSSPILVSVLVMITICFRCEFIGFP